MFNIFSSSKTIHTCLSLTEDDCINHVPNGFQCTLPDGGQWFQLSGKKAKVAGGVEW